MDEFQRKIESLWTSFDDELIETCVLQLFELSKEKQYLVQEIDMTISDYYFLEIGNEIVLAFYNYPGLNNFIKKKFNYNIHEKWYEFYTKSGLIYKFVFI